MSLSSNLNGSRKGKNRVNRSQPFFFLFTFFFFLTQFHLFSFFFFVLFTLCNEFEKQTVDDIQESSRAYNSL
ncbi:unnamed protein product [Brassica napus]|uniref:(rape) hypothetical protein n=1 Tax=Brassica napus TaxID=3708 RepID=A0A817AT34_BRANA|nr:unnamed protein product [Brassica napus]